MVRPSGRGDLAKVVVSERSPKRGPLVPPQRNPETPPTASSQDLSSLHRRERSSLVKNRTRESCTSGSVRGGDGNVPTYSAERSQNCFLLFFVSALFFSYSTQSRKTFHPQFRRRSFHTGCTTECSSLTSTRMFSL